MNDIRNFLTWTQASLKNGRSISRSSTSGNKLVFVGHPITEGFRPGSLYDISVAANQIATAVNIPYISMKLAVILIEISEDTCFA